MAPTCITFYSRFADDILAGLKTITIRDESESDFVVGSVVDLAHFEDQQVYGKVKIESVSALNFDDISEQHAVQENMTLTELKGVIREIYPATDKLFVIEFSLVK